MATRLQNFIGLGAKGMGYGKRIILMLGGEIFALGLLSPIARCPLLPTFFKCQTATTPLWFQARRKQSILKI